MSLVVPKDYDPVLSVRETQEAVKFICDSFQTKMETELGLSRVSAPIFVKKSSGINDNLSGEENPVCFKMKAVPGEDIEIVHSLAKGKRMALAKYNFETGKGLFTNMKAIRKDEDLDNLHSIYVDQGDGERSIKMSERTFRFLQSEVEKIFEAIKNLEFDVGQKYPNAVYRLPEKIHFITCEELLQKYPELKPKERENEICKELGCVFLAQIGKTLSDGSVHDLRAPDYDDWELNGDILFWFEPLQCALEISSMGIRVNAKTMQEQLKAAKTMDRIELPYHQDIINNKLPQSIGGGIGQSRLCMLLLKKAHIGEIQASVWPDKMVEECACQNINLL